MFGRSWLLTREAFTADSMPAVATAGAGIRSWFAPRQIVPGRVDVATGLSFGPVERMFGPSGTWNQPFVSIEIFAAISVIDKEFRNSKMTEFSKLCGSLNIMLVASPTVAARDGRLFRSRAE